MVTVPTSIGMEFTAVILIWLDQFHNCYNTDNPQRAILSRRALYVAMTRAREKLYLIGSENAKVVQDLKNQRFVQLRRS